MCVVWIALYAASVVALVRLWGSPYTWMFWTVLALMLLDWFFTAAARESARMGDEDEAYGVGEGFGDSRGRVTLAIVSATWLLRLALLVVTAWAFVRL